MAGIAGRDNFHNPVRRPGAASISQLVGVADHADVWFYHVSVIFGKQFDGKGSRIDFTGTVFGVNIVGDGF